MLTGRLGGWDTGGGWAAGEGVSLLVMVDGGDDDDDDDERSGGFVFLWQEFCRSVSCN